MAPEADVFGAVGARHRRDLFRDSLVAQLCEAGQSRVILDSSKPRQAFTGNNRLEINYA